LDKVGGRDCANGSNFDNYNVFKDLALEREIGEI
jgi:hypothetical protein